MHRWIRENLCRRAGAFPTAFHPDYKMMDTPATNRHIDLRAREIGIAKACAVYTGNGFTMPWVAAPRAQAAGQCRIVRDWYSIRHWRPRRVTAAAKHAGWSDAWRVRRTADTGAAPAAKGRFVPDVNNLTSTPIYLSKIVVRVITPMTEAVATNTSPLLQML